MLSFARLDFAGKGDFQLVMRGFELHCPLFLVGFMGVGKSTAGRRLARDFSVDFVDMDEQIAQRAGCGIQEIFRCEGEEGFRKLERSVLEELVEIRRGVVIATGGGAPCHLDGMERMRDAGYTVYLHLPEEELVSRLRTAGKKRPLLAGLRGDSLATYVRDTLSRREATYRQAHITADARTVNGTTLIQLLELLPK